LHQIAKMLRLFLLLIFAVNQCYGDIYRWVNVTGEIFCIDANQSSHPVLDGSVDLMELDYAPSGGFWRIFTDTDDHNNTTQLLNSNKFEVSGSHWEESYDVKCHMGVKTSEATYDGFSCIGGLTPGRAYLSRENY
ncbi:hypothetical protein PFISCL1PPCAC_18995, partial [Pristionchus fissidentatus]